MLLSDSIISGGGFMYIVIEIQKNEQVATLVNAYEDRNLAEQKYHQILSAAAVSSVLTHSAVMLEEDGRLLKRETYSHPVEEIEEG